MKIAAIFCFDLREKKKMIGTNEGMLISIELLLETMLPVESFILLKF
jgi:hypothetical protein